MLSPAGARGPGARTHKRQSSYRQEALWPRTRSGAAQSTGQGGPLGHSPEGQPSWKRFPHKMKGSGKVEADGEQANSALGECVSVQLIKMAKKISLRT